MQTFYFFEFFFFCHLDMMVEKQSFLSYKGFRERIHLFPTLSCPVCPAWSQERKDTRGALNSEAQVSLHMPWCVSTAEPHLSTIHILKTAKRAEGTKDARLKSWAINTARSSPLLCVCAQSLQSCLTLSDSMDCSLPATLSAGFFRKEYWSRLPFSTPRDFPNPEIEPASLYCWVTGEVWFPSYCYCCQVAQSCLTLSDPMDCSLPGSSVHGIFQARVLEWGAIAFSGFPSYINLKYVWYYLPLKLKYFETSRTQKDIRIS